MIARDFLLFQLVSLINRLPTVPGRHRGSPRFYPNRLFLEVLPIKIVRSLHKVGGPLAVLNEPTQEMRYLRKLLREDRHFTVGRTFERKLRVPPEIVLEKRATAPYTSATD